MLPSRQHCEPWQKPLMVPGHRTFAPTVQCVGDGGAGGHGGGPGPGGAGGPGGVGAGAVPLQEKTLGAGQHWKPGSAEGQVVPPAAQHSLPAHCAPPPFGHSTLPPITHEDGPVACSLRKPCVDASDCMLDTPNAALLLPQTHAGSAPVPPGLLVSRPIALMICSIVPLPSRNTANGSTKDDTKAAGQVMPVCTVTGWSRKK